MVVQKPRIYVSLTFSNFNENVVRLSNEHPTELIDLVGVLRFNLREGREVEVLTTPEENLLWKLVLVLKVEAHGDVVVLLNPLDLSPQQYLVECGGLRKLHESQLQLHPMNTQPPSTSRVGITSPPG